MKTSVVLLTLSFLLPTSIYAKIISSNDLYYIQTRKGNVPVMSVNKMISEKNISNIKIYGNGMPHLISFAKKNGPVKLYSVDEIGYIYSIEPFTSYTVSTTEDDGQFQFNEVPGRKYNVDSKGFFFH